MNKKVVLALVFLASFLVLPLTIADSSYAVSESTWYGDQLSGDEKTIYDACIDPYEDGLNPLDKEWIGNGPTPVVSVIDQVIIDKAVKVASIDNPGYFWLWKAPTIVDGKLSFDVSDINTVVFVTKMKAFASAMSGNTVSEKMTSIDSELRSKVEYYNVPEDNVNYDPLNGTVYGAIINSKANSYGFAAAVTFCAKELGVEAVTICGELNNPDGSKAHAWNTIKNENGDWYGVDIALNKQKNTARYIMMAANDHGYQTNYTFKASHSADMSSYLVTDVIINTPELHVRIFEPPAEPTFIEKYGPHILIITIITVLCVVMLTYVKRG